MSFENDSLTPDSATARAILAALSELLTLGNRYLAESNTEDYRDFNKAFYEILKIERELSDRGSKRRHLSERARQILDILKKNQTWMSRSDIASSLGRGANKLTKRDDRAIEELQARSLIVIFINEKDRPSEVVITYRSN